MANAVPTATELESLSAACDRLWQLDKNRLQPGVHYELDLQHGKTSWQQGDVAADPLFKFVDQSVFERPTFRLFFKLLDNYERGVGIRETVTAEELGENSAFLNAILETAPMRYAHAWLTKKKKFVGDLSAFKKKLDEIWFGLYRRQTHNDSSGFEHVFLGEEKDGKICGCHNWIQIYNEERAGRLNYLGYIKPKQRGCRITEPQSHEQLLSIQLMWEKEIKPVSTSLIGVSPEFEMALYTMCFLNGKEDNIVQLGPYRCNIKCYAFGHGHNVKIGSAFPDTAPLTEEQAAIKIQAHARGVLARHQQNHHHHHPPPPHHHHPQNGQQQQTTYQQTTYQQTTIRQQQQGYQQTTVYQQTTIQQQSYRSPPAPPAMDAQKNWPRPGERAAPPAPHVASTGTEGNAWSKPHKW